jgi:hypothetical protein
LVAARVSAQNRPAVRLPAREDSRLWIEGRTNLNAWSCKATILDAAIDVDLRSESASADDAATIPMVVKRVDVKLPVTGLKCGNGRMERMMYASLKAEESADARYIVGSFAAAPGESNDTLVHAAGTLRIAGRENTVHLNVRAAQLSDGTVRAESELPILMTDYGVKPPTAFLGALRARDKVVVKFELFIAPQKVIAMASGTAANVAPPPRRGVGQ